MRRLFTAAAATLVLTACSGTDSGGSAPSNGDAGTDATATAPSAFETDIAPIIATSCVTCHLTGQEAGNMALVPAKVRESLVAVPAVGAPGLQRVVPGDPDKSYLVMKLEGTQLEHGGTGARMPFGNPPLPTEQIAKIRQWIANGAKP